MSFNIRPRATTAAARQALLGLGLPSAHSAALNGSAAGLRPASLCVGERKFSPSHNLAAPTHCERSISLRSPRHELFESGFVTPPSTPVLGHYRMSNNSSSRLASSPFVRSPDLRFPPGAYNIKSPRFKAQTIHFSPAGSGGRSPVLQAARSRGLGIGSPSFNSKSPNLAPRSPLLGPEPSRIHPNAAPSLISPSRPKTTLSRPPPEALKALGSPSLRSPLLKASPAIPSSPRLATEPPSAPATQYPQSPTFRRLQEQHSVWEDEEPVQNVLKERVGRVARANGQLEHKENAMPFAPVRKTKLSTSLSPDLATNPTVVIHSAVTDTEMTCMTSQECHILEAELPTTGKAGSDDYCVSAYVRNHHGFKVVADSSRMVNGHHEWLIEFPTDVDMGTVKVSFGGSVLRVVAERRV